MGVFIVWPQVQVVIAPVKVGALTRAIVDEAQPLVRDKGHRVDVTTADERTIEAEGRRETAEHSVGLRGKNALRGNEKQQIKEAARQLGLGVREVGKAIERIKKASGRGGAQNVEIDPVTGDVVGDGVDTAPPADPG